MKGKKPFAWAKARLFPKAKAILKDPRKLRELLDVVESKLSMDYFKEQFKAFWDDLKTLVSLLKAAATGKYKVKSKRSLILMVLGLLYFINPLDLIPDLLVGGFVDDAAFLGWIITQVKDEIEHFKAS